MSPDQDEAALGALAERMKALLGPFVLRRTKAEVATQLVAKDQRLVPPTCRVLSLQSMLAQAVLLHTSYLAGRAATRRLSVRFHGCLDAH